jgi:mono/diheme cytochrome c family protein
MRASHRFVFGLLIFLAVGIAASRLLSRESMAAPAQKGAVAPATQSMVDRGRYLVENVAMCEECHTPRDANGNLDESRRLQGAPIWILPVHPNPNWSMNAPPLAGFGGYTDEQGQAVLEKGVGPNGLAVREPMHIYHMNHADAQAIIAYLRSLPGTYPH